MGLELMQQSLPWSLRTGVNGASPQQRAHRRVRSGLELPPLRAIRARITVFEFAAVVAGTDSAVDARLEKSVDDNVRGAARRFLVRERRLGRRAWECLTVTMASFVVQHFSKPQRDDR